MGLLDIDNVINNEQPLFNALIISLIKNKRTDMTCWLNWKVNDGFYKYNPVTQQLESTLYDFDPRNWLIYQLWGTSELVICKGLLDSNKRFLLKISPVRVYGTHLPISLEKLTELVNK